MKYNNTIQIVSTVIKAITDPMYIRNKLEESEILQFTNDSHLNNNIDNSIYSEYNSSNKEYNESTPTSEDNKYYNDSKSVHKEDSKYYNDKKNNDYYNNKQQDTSSDSQGVIDSITQEMTPVRLQQAIILSEIVGKPKCKTRKRRRF